GEGREDEGRRWLEGLPDLPLPAGGEQAAVWFNDYIEVRDPDRLRTFGEVGSDDAFARWQGQLQKVLGDKAAFQTAVSFARIGGEGGEDEEWVRGGRGREDGGRRVVRGGGRGATAEKADAGGAEGTGGEVAGTCQRRVNALSGGQVDGC